MANERIASVKLRFETDKAAFANVEAQTKRLQNSLANLGREKALQQASRDALTFASGGLKAEQVSRTLNLRLKELGANSKEVRRVTDEFTRLSTEAEKAANSMAGGSDGGRRGSSKLTKLGMGIRNMPALELGGGLSTDVIGKFTAVIGALNPAAIGATVAIAGVAIALSALINNATKARETALAALDAQERARLLAATASAEELRAQRATAEANLARALEEERLALELTTGMRTGIRDAYGEVGVAIIEFNKTLGTGGAELKAAEEDLTKAQTATAAARAELGVYNSAINSNAFAAREAAEAEAKLAEARQKYYDAFVNAEVSALRDSRSINDTGALRERVQSLQDERKLYEDIIATRGLSEQAQQQYLDKIRDIDAALQVFTRRGLVAEIEAREREAQAIERATKARENMIARAEAITKAQIDAAKATDSFNASLEKIATDARGKLADAARDRSKALVDAEQDAQKARAEASTDRETSITEVTRKAGIDREKQTREHLKRLAEINRRADLDLQTAIEDRDSVAQSRIQRERAEAVRSENDSYAEQQTEVDRNLQEQTRTISQRYAEQTATINARLNEQTAAVNARYVEQVQSIYAAANAARQAEITSYQQRLATLTQSLQTGLRISTQAAMAALGVQQQYWQSTLALVQQSLASINAVRSRASAMPASGVRLPSTISRATPARIGGSRGFLAFDTGGYITRSGAAMVHEGEYIMNPRRGQYPVNFSPTVNMGAGGGTEQIKQILHAEVDRFAAQLAREAM
jgi:hypothetical protein